MKMDRRVFTKGLAAALALPSWATKASAAKLPVNRVTKIRCYYPANYQANGPQAFPQSNMVVLVDTEAGITGIGQGGSPDTVRNMARSVIGKNAFDTEFIWQHGFDVLRWQEAIHPKTPFHIRDILPFVDAASFAGPSLGRVSFGAIGL